MMLIWFNQSEINDNFISPGITDSRGMAILFNNNSEYEINMKIIHPMKFVII